MHDQVFSETSESQIVNKRMYSQGKPMTPSGDNALHQLDIQSLSEERDKSVKDEDRVIPSGVQCGIHCVCKDSFSPVCKRKVHLVSSAVPKGHNDTASSSPSPKSSEHAVHDLLVSDNEGSDPHDDVAELLAAQMSYDNIDGQISDDDDDDGQGDSSETFELESSGFEGTTADVSSNIDDVREDAADSLPVTKQIKKTRNTHRLNDEIYQPKDLAGEDLYYTLCLLIKWNLLGAQYTSHKLDDYIQQSDKSLYEIRFT